MGSGSTVTSMVAVRRVNDEGGEKEINGGWETIGLKTGVRGRDKVFFGRKLMIFQASAGAFGGVKRCG